MVSWDDIEIRIPTVLSERCEYVDKLATQIRTETGVSPWLSPQPAGFHPRDRIQRVFGYEVDAKWLLYMEDDVYLADTFAETIPRVLAETDRVAVQFCDFRDGDSGLSTARKPLYSMQCVAIRSDIVTGFAPFYADWIESVDHENATDIAFGKYCTEIGEPVDVYRPSQVQHRELPSTLGPRSSQRQSRLLNSGWIRRISNGR